MPFNKETYTESKQLFGVFVLLQNIFCGKNYIHAWLSREGDPLGIEQTIRFNPSVYALTNSIRLWLTVHIWIQGSSQNFPNITDDNKRRLKKATGYSGQNVGNISTKINAIVQNE